MFKDGIEIPNKEQFTKFVKFRNTVVKKIKKDGIYAYKMEAPRPFLKRKARDILSYKGLDYDERKIADRLFAEFELYVDTNLI